MLKWRRSFSKINVNVFGGLDMQVYKTILIEEKKIDKVFCNMCGDEIEEISNGRKKDFLHIEKTWGYGSEMDGESHSIDLCEKCYKEIIEKCKMNVRK